MYSFTHTQYIFICIYISKYLHRCEMYEMKIRQNADGRTFIA